MTKHADRKTAARALAAEQGINYTAALRLIEKIEAEAPRSMRLVSFQQEQRPDGVLPYPFHVQPSGFLGQQDFWHGEPYRLIGFVTDAEVRDIDVRVPEFLGDPEQVVGMHPVLADIGGAWATYRGKVESIEDREVSVSAPEVSVRARFYDPNCPVALDIEVGDMLHAYTNDMLREMHRSGWSPSDEIDLMLARAEAEGNARAAKVADWLNEQDDEPVPCLRLDPEQAEAWLARWRPVAAR